jgi:hypothetical protein
MPVSPAVHSASARGRVPAQNWSFASRSAPRWAPRDPDSASGPGAGIRHSVVRGAPWAAVRASDAVLDGRRHPSCGREPSPMHSGGIVRLTIPRGFRRSMASGTIIGTQSQQASIRGNAASHHWAGCDATGANGRAAGGCRRNLPVPQALSGREKSGRAGVGWPARAGKPARAGTEGWDKCNPVSRGGWYGSECSGQWNRPPDVVTLEADSQSDLHPVAPLAHPSRD